MENILFYTPKWYVFDNFSALQVNWHGYYWPTVEHAYQGAKFDAHPAIKQMILAANSPYAAYTIAHENEDKMDSDWDDKKLAVMSDIIRLKLRQHPVVQRKLLKSGDRELVEDSPTDSFWGRGPDGGGENNLGKIWMKLRDEIFQLEQDAERHRMECGHM